MTYGSCVCCAVTCFSFLLWDIHDHVGSKLHDTRCIKELQTNDAMLHRAIFAPNSPEKQEHVISPARSMSHEGTDQRRGREPSHTYRVSIISLADSGSSRNVSFERRLAMSCSWRDANPMSERLYSSATTSSSTPQSDSIKAHIIAVRSLPAWQCMRMG